MCCRQLKLYDTELQRGIPIKGYGLRQLEVFLRQNSTGHQRVLIFKRITYRSLNTQLRHRLHLHHPNPSL
jgi:hypothetical protein